MTHSFPTRRSSDLIINQQTNTPQCDTLDAPQTHGYPARCAYGPSPSSPLLVCSSPPAQRPKRPTSKRATGCRSEEHTSELQSLMRISYAVFCLKKKQRYLNKNTTHVYRINT